MLHVQSKDTFSDLSDNNPSPIIPLVKQNHPITKSKTNSSNKKQKRSKHKSDKRQKHQKLFRPSVCVSDFIGSQRLTHKLGIFQRGKISGKVSRLEEYVSEEVQARTEQDLHKILNLSKGNKNISNGKNYVCSPGIRGKANSHYKENNILFKKKYVSSSLNRSQNSNFHRPEKRKCLSSTPVPFINKITPTSNWSSDGSHSNSGSHRKSVLNGLNSCVIKSPLQDVNEFKSASTIIINKLHTAVKEANRVMFPDSNLKNSLKSELLKLKNHHCNKTLSSSRTLSISSEDFYVDSELLENVNGCSSKDIKQNDVSFQLNIRSEREVKDSFPVDKQETTVPFKLNICPELTHKPLKDKTKMFPTIDEFFTNHDVPIIVEKRTVTFSPSSYDSRLDYSRSNSCKLNCKDSSFTLVPCTPDSDGTPVWFAKVSPAKLPPKSPPTPKLYFRQKMY